jgi:hypothetical protein
MLPGTLITGKIPAKMTWKLTRSMESFTKKWMK